MKKIVSIVAACAMAVVGVSAGGKREAAAVASAALRIGIVTTAGVDDRLFNENNYDGILDFIKEYPDTTVVDVKESDQSKAVQVVTGMIGDYDVLVLPGFQFAGVGALLAHNPERKAILVDAFPVDEEGEEVFLPNVYAMLFHEEESGFFAGVAAALETRGGKVAVVTGISYPSNVNYQFGFVSGVNYANKHYGAKAVIVDLPAYAGTDIAGKPVGGNYIGSFEDEATGKAVGNALIAQGVDVIFVAAGNSGRGVMAAAKEAIGVYIIGVDVDQWDAGEAGGRNVILTSALKVMRINVYRQLKAIKDGTFKGGNVMLGADTGSTGYVSEPGRQQLQAGTLARLAEVYAAVKSGAITPAANFTLDTPANFHGL